MTNSQYIALKGLNIKDKVETNKMTNKIEPVSKAAAKFFADQCIQIREAAGDARYSFVSFLEFHGVVGVRGSDYLDFPSFGQFCRAVADQLDPSPPFCEVGSDINVMRKCFKLGFGVAMPSPKISPDSRCPWDDEEIDQEFKNVGLIGDKQND